MKEKNSILVADDDLAHRTMLRKLLSDWGYAVEEADDGGTAVLAAQRQPFDLILMDIRMIKVSGLTALAEIKSFNPAIPIVIMTAYASVETAVEALKKGAYDYLTKPLDFDELRRTIERSMEHSRLKEENRLLKESIADRFDRRSGCRRRLIRQVLAAGPARRNRTERNQRGHDADDGDIGGEDLFLAALARGLS